MPELQLVRLAAQREAEQLVSQADAEDRLLADQLANVADLRDQRLRIARAVGEKDSVGIERQHVLRAGQRRHHGDPAPRMHQPPQNIVLDAVIVRDHVVAGFGLPADQIGGRTLLHGLGPLVCFARAHTAGQIESGHSRNPARLFDQFLPVALHRREHAAHHAARPQVAHQRARVQIADDRYSRTRQEGVGRGIAAPIAGGRRKLANHQPLNVRAFGLVVRGTGSVVADLGIGQDHDLPGIRGIGEDFLISRESGIEDNFAASLGGRTKTPALEDVPVLQGEYCIGQFRLFLPGRG